MTQQHFRMLACWLGAIFLPLTSGGTERDAAKPLTLVEDGKPKAAIIVPSRKRVRENRNSQQAVNTLREAIKDMSGATLPVLEEDHNLAKLSVGEDGMIRFESDILPKDINTFILVGNSELAEHMGFDIGNVGAGGILIKTKGNALALLGSPDPVDCGTTLWAVSQFLETLGFRNLWPGPLGKITPPKSTVIVDPIKIAYSPQIKQRHMRAGALFVGKGSAFLGYDNKAWRAFFEVACAGNTLREWLWWHRLGGDIGLRGGHAFGDYWERYGKEHPEWFAMQQDGSRSQEGSGTRGRLCVSNPELVSHIADTIIAQAKANPALKCFSICPNDGGYSSFCMCENCRKLDPPSAPKVKLFVFEKVGSSKRHEIEYPALTDRFVHFWNHISDRVSAECPDVLLGIDSYSAYKPAPVKEKLRPNQVVRYVSSSFRYWDGWRQAGAKRIFWRPNTLLQGFREGRVDLCPHYFSRVFKQLAEDGVMAIDADSIVNHWAMHGLNYYVFAKLCWNPNADVDEIIDDYCAKGFGEAAPHVKKYFKLVEDVYEPRARIMLTPEHHLSATRYMEEIKLINGLQPSSAQYAEMENALDAAAQSAKDAGNDDVVRRIVFLRRGLDISKLIADIDLMADFEKRGEPYDKEKAHRLMRQYIEIAADTVEKQTLAVNFGPIISHSNWQRIGWQQVVLETRGEERANREITEE